jgi:hypothetical protein
MKALGLSTKLLQIIECLLLGQAPHNFFLTTTPGYLAEGPCNMGVVGTGADPGFNAQERTNKALTTDPFGNTCEADEVSPEVEAGVVVGLRCLQP